MSISLLLEMAQSPDPYRTPLGVAELSALADGGAGVTGAFGAKHVAYVATVLDEAGIRDGRTSPRLKSRTFWSSICTCMIALWLAPTIPSGARSLSPSWCRRRCDTRHGGSALFRPLHGCGSRTPDKVVFRDELPTNATGKVLRRDLVTELNLGKALE